MFWHCALNYLIYGDEYGRLHISRYKVLKNYKNLDYDNEVFDQLVNEVTSDLESPLFYEDLFSSPSISKKLDDIEQYHNTNYYSIYERMQSIG